MNEAEESLRLQEIWLDTHGTPHETGKTIPPHQAWNAGICATAMWEEEDNDYQPFAPEDGEEQK